MQTLLGEVWELWGAAEGDCYRSLALGRAPQGVVVNLTGPWWPWSSAGKAIKDGSEDVRGFKAAFLRGLVTPTRSLLLSSAVANARTVSDVAGNAKLAKSAQGGRHSHGAATMQRRPPFSGRCRSAGVRRSRGTGPSPASGR